MKRAILPLLALAILSGACSIGAPNSSGGQTSDRVVGTAPILQGAPEPAKGESRDTVSGQGSVAIPIVSSLDPNRALVLTANIGLQSEDPWAAADRAEAIAVGLGGGVVGMSQSGRGDQRVAHLTLRVPAATFNDALRQLRSMSGVEVASSTVESKDVTDQFVDLEARLRAKQAEEVRYLALLARAERIEDILRIDQSLSAVRTQIEQLTGQVNSLKGRTEFSLISLGITPPPNAVAAPAPYDPAKTAERALAALASTFRFVTDAAIWVLILGWLPLAIVGGFLLVQRRRRPMAAA